VPAVELEVICGQRSAHSLATGPMMAEPLISPLGLMMTPTLSEGQEEERERMGDTEVGRGEESACVGVVSEQVKEGRRGQDFKRVDR
jgi:hypothetical protein